MTQDGLPGLHSGGIAPAPTVAVGVASETGSLESKFHESIAAHRESGILVALDQVDDREYLWYPYLAPFSIRTPEPFAPDGHLWRVTLPLLSGAYIGGLD